MKNLIPIIFLALVAAFTLAWQRHRVSYEKALEGRAEAVLEAAAVDHPALRGLRCEADHLYLRVIGSVENPETKQLVGELLASETPWKLMNEVVVKRPGAPSENEVPAPTPAPTSEVAKVKPPQPPGPSVVPSEKKPPIVAQVPSAAPKDVKQEKPRNPAPPVVTPPKAPAKPAVAPPEPPGPKVVKLAPLPPPDLSPKADAASPRSPVPTEPPAVPKVVGAKPEVVAVEPKPKVAEPAPVATPPKQPPAVAVKPPVVAVKPPAVAVKPPAVAVKPPAVVVKPPAVAVKPPAVAVKPPAVAVKPPVVATKPDRVVSESTEPSPGKVASLVSLDEVLPASLLNTKSLADVLAAMPITFDRNEAAIRDPQERQIMNVAIELLKEGVEHTVVLTGRYASGRNDSEQKQLVQERTERVKDAMWQYGIREDLIKTKVEGVRGWKKHQVDVSLKP